jgi:hypothetical protein
MILATIDLVKYNSFGLAHADAEGSDALAISAMRLSVAMARSPANDQSIHRSPSKTQKAPGRIRPATLAVRSERRPFISSDREGDQHREGSESRLLCRGNVLPRPAARVNEELSHHALGRSLQDDLGFA